MAGGQRLDKWLWHARFFKTRTLASRVVSEGKVRVNDTAVSKPSRLIVEGDRLAFEQARDMRFVEIAALSTRRGPASEAQTLYVDHTPPPLPKPLMSPEPRREAGRPTKKDRRDMDKLSQNSVTKG